MPSAKEKAEIQNIHKKWPHEGDCNSYEKALFALIATTRREALREAEQKCKAIEAACSQEVNIVAALCADAIHQALAAEDERTTR